MDEKGPLFPAVPWTPGRCLKQAAPSPSDAASSSKQGKWFEQGVVRTWESHEALKINQKTSVDAAHCCWMAAAREHVNARGHWCSHAWVEWDRGSSSMFQWGQGVFQSRSSRLAHRTHVSACIYLHIAFSLLLLATSVLFIGLCTLSLFSLKKYKEFLFENISPKAEAVA